MRVLPPVWWYGSGPRVELELEAVFVVGVAPPVAQRVGGEPAPVVVGVTQMEVARVARPAAVVGVVVVRRPPGPARGQRDDDRAGGGRLECRHGRRGGGGDVVGRVRGDGGGGDVGRVGGGGSGGDVGRVRGGGGGGGGVGRVRGGGVGCTSVAWAAAAAVLWFR